MHVDGDAMAEELPLSLMYQSQDQILGTRCLIHFFETVFEELIPPAGSINVDHRNKQIG